MEGERAARVLAKQKLNIAPRFSVAYAPDGKTSVRAGFGLYFDHFGQGVVNTFDELGSLGKYGAVLTRPRIQRFSLRVDF